MKPLTRLFTSCSLCWLLVGCATAPQTDCQLDVELLADTPQLLDPAFASVSRRNSVREQQVWELFEAIGCSKHYREKVRRSRHHNIICEIEGTMEDSLLIGAHHDRLGSGDGIADNWTGIAILASLASYYADHPPIHTLRFVAFADEEVDMHGSRHHVRQLKQNDSLPRVMINVDTIGVSTLSLERRADKHLNCLARQYAEQLDIGIRSTLVRGMAGDWEPFDDAGVPVVTFHSVNQHEVKKLHTWEDKISLVDEQRFEEGFRVITEVVSAIDHGVDLTIRR